MSNWLSAFKLTELTCSGSIPVQVAGLVLLTILAIGLYLWGTVMSLNIHKGGNMKIKMKFEKFKLKIDDQYNKKLKLICISVVMTANAILASFLGGSPMLA